MEVLHQVVVISLIIGALIMNYRVWFKDMVEKQYKMWEKYLPRTVFIFLIKTGAIIFLIVAIAGEILIIIR